MPKREDERSRTVEKEYVLIHRDSRETIAEIVPVSNVEDFEQIVKTGAYILTEKK